MNLNNIFLVTDADGTLLTDDKRILGKDRKAIREITQSGGLFTIATGRGVTLARRVAEEAELLIPAVIFNGAAVYDFAKESFLWKCALPEIADDYIKLLTERFPTLGVEILLDENVYVAATNEWEEKHLAYGCPNPLRCKLDEVPPDNRLKALFVDEPGVIDGVIAFSREQNFSGIHLVRSAPVFYEMLPEGVDKGGGVKKLLELTGINNRYIVAAGDYNNDLEMVREADLGVAVANAEEVVKKAADLTVCDNNSGALWEIVEYLKHL